MIQETFLPHIFFRKTKTLSPIIGNLSMMPLKMAGLGLLNLVPLDKKKYIISHWESAELISAMTGGGAFSNADQLRTLGEERRDGKKDREVAKETKLKGLVQDLRVTNRRLILRSKITGAFMSVRGTTVSGTLLSAI